MPPMPGTSRLDAQPGLQRAAVAMLRNDFRSRDAAQGAPDEGADRRARHPHAGRGRHALGRDDDAKTARALPRARAGFSPARYSYACAAPANDALARCRDRAPARRGSAQPGYRNLAAVILSRVGEYERSSRHLRGAAARSTRRNAKVWLSYGHVLKTEGRQDESIAAYRRSIALRSRLRRGVLEPRQPQDLPLRREADLAAMRARLDDPAVDDANRVHLHFALGKACEDAGDYAASFEHYAKGNALHRARHPLRRRPEHRAHPAPEGDLHARVLRRARRRRLPGARPDLHRRHAARGLDAARADPVQPLGGRGHERAARDHHDGPGPARARPTRRTPAPTRTSWPA